MNSGLCLAATAVAAVFALLAITTRFPSPPENLDDRQTEYAVIHDGAGPESFAFDAAGGGPYAGISDGRIIKWLPDERKWIDFAVTSPDRTGCEERENQEEREERCGRPLGLRFGGRDGDLYIADAYKGLLRVSADGGLATRIEIETTEGLQGSDSNFTFANALDIDEASGHVYFTLSSSLYPRRNFISAILSADNSGKLMKYDLESKELSILLRNLSFPNGVSLSRNGDFLLLVETTKCRILKYWLKTPKAGTYEVVAELPGFPDNMKPSPRGGYWVGMHSRRRGLSRAIMSWPWIGRGLVKLLPLDIGRVYSWLGKWIGSGGFGMRVSEEGEILEVMMEGKGGLKWKSISEVEERENGDAWIGSIDTPFAAKIQL